MSDIKHTPGPWNATDPLCGFVKSGGQLIATVYGDNEDCTRDARMDANANLIAAAPELLAALKALVFQTHDFSSSEIAGLGLFTTLEMARTAIAKAEGRS